MNWLVERNVLYTTSRDKASLG